jgi:heptosyltransferase-2
MKDPANIIVRMPNWIGDVVMATPILADLRKRFPTASITAMCRRPLSQLLEKESSIDELFSFSRPSNGFARRQAERDIIEKLRKGGYDAGILLTNSFSSAWWFWQGKVKRRIGFSGHWRRLLLTDPIPPVPKGEAHLVEVYKRLLIPLGLSPSHSTPHLSISSEERNQAQALLRQRGFQKGAPLIGIHAGAAYGSAKCWPPERFQALAHLLLKEGAKLLFVGDEATSPLVKTICQGLPEGAMNLAGGTTLRELVALIHECSVFVTNDSGPMHIAAALDVPVVALFGSTDEKSTGPYGQSEGVIRKQVSCSPCFKRVCPIDFRCMREISPEEVARKVWERKPHV